MKPFLSFFRRLYWLYALLILAAVPCAYSFANTPDCNVALETCKADCAQRKIYDRERGGIVTRTDFVSQCQNACVDAADWCLKQDSTSSCATFGYHCESQCPWSVVDYTHERLQHTDSFRQCENSCIAGAQACEPYRKGLPSRKRTREFDQCPEAQTACYADCILEIKDNKQNFSIIDTDYPDTCAKACAQGVQDCQVLDDAESCDTYETSCEADCPSSVTAFGQPKSDPMVKQWCRNSCAVGRAYCRSLQGLPFDRTTAPAIKSAVVPPPAPAPSAASKPSGFKLPTIKLPDFKAPAANSKPAAKPAPAAKSAGKPTEYNVTHCADAEAYCKADCRKNKIINVMNGMWPERYSNEAETDFWQQCESACVAAKPQCLAGYGFKTACREACPRAYHERSTGNTYAENDGQNRCQWSCTIGQDAYEGNGDKNICELGYVDCEAVCADDADMFGGDKYYDMCNNACKAGEAQCPNALPLNYCHNFYDTCKDKCPESTSDTDEGAGCQGACQAGAHKCQERADLSYD